MRVDSPLTVLEPAQRLKCPSREPLLNEQRLPFAEANCRELIAGAPLLVRGQLRTGEYLFVFLEDQMFYIDEIKQLNQFHGKFVRYFAATFYHGSLLSPVDFKK